MRGAWRGRKKSFHAVERERETSSRRKKGHRTFLPLLPESRQLSYIFTKIAAPPRGAISPSALLRPLVAETEIQSRARRWP